MAIWIHLLASTEALTNGILDIITTSFFFSLATILYRER